MKFLASVSVGRRKTVSACRCALVSHCVSLCVVQVYEREPRDLFGGLADGGVGSLPDGLTPSQIALDWEDHWSQVVNVDDLADMERSFIDQFDAEHQPLDRLAEARISVCTCEHSLLSGEVRESFAFG